MNLKVFVSNPLINTGVISWVLAQIIKTVIDFFKHKSFNKKKLAGAGGMPSSHSAVVCSVLLRSFLEYGFSSPIFAISFIFALVVMYDATGVRWSAGLHAKAINHIVEYLEDDKNKNKEDLQKLIPTLNESIGHRMIEVICGAALGFSVSGIFYILK